jgi:hypothetical protein
MGSDHADGARREQPCFALLRARPWNALVDADLKLTHPADLG